MKIRTTCHFENMQKEGGHNQDFLVKFCQTNLPLCQNDRTDISFEITSVIYLDFK